MKKLISLLGNSQRLDGGAMFGNAPKVVWEKWVKVDDKNRIVLATRALLVQEDSKNILIESGIGAFFEPKLKERYGVIEEHHVLLESLKNINLSDQDIDYVILSHLHFDHAGGIVSSYEENKPLELLFPKAKFIVSNQAWARANQPHPRDKASFVPEINQLLKESNRLILVEGDNLAELGQDFKFHYSHGHTPGMLLTEINMPEGPVMFMADLIPGTPWVHVPITMGYDRYPEEIINEKAKILEDLSKRNGRLFYTHDPKFAYSSVQEDERGRFIVLNPKEQMETSR